MPEAFGGFEPTLFQFLADLESNNERAWFDENRDRYEKEVREPARAFIRGMAKPLAKISKEIVASDKKVGGSLMRVHRDIRFSADKTPYKTNVGIQFRHSAGKNVHAPGLYVHLALDSCFLGAGLWRPEKEPLTAIRKAIAERSADWKRARRGKALADWELGGESLKRPPRGFDPDHPLIEDIKRKSFIAVLEFDHERAVAPDFSRFVASRFRSARPLVSFLTEAVGLPF